MSSNQIPNFFQMQLHLLLAVFGTVSALPSYTSHHELSTIPSYHKLVTHQVYDVPKLNTWYENLAVRSNGKILATRLDVPQLYEFSPQDPFSEPNLVHTFSSATGLAGITEVVGRPDVFVVLAGNFLSETAPGNHTLWTVDMSKPTPKIASIAILPTTALLPNGMASLDASEHAVLISDSTVLNGSVWRCDLKSGAYTLAIADPKMKKTSPAAGQGVNGIRIFNGYLYFTNSFAPYLARIPIHANGTAAGASEIVGYSVKTDWTFDDFAIAEDGTAYVATGTGNAVTRITPDGKVTILPINETSLESPTSVQFGRTEKDRWTIYVTTNGGEEGILNGTVILKSPLVGAQLVAIELR